MQPAKSNLVRHLHCENDPAVTKHNRIPSVINPPTTLVIPFTLSKRSQGYKL